MESASDIENTDIIREQGDDTNEPDVTITHRQSTRQRRIPRWMNDYVVNNTIADDIKTEGGNNISLKAPTTYTPPTFPYNVPRHLEETYVNYLTNLSTTCEPHTFKQAKEDKEWVKAMQQEIKSLEDNRIWSITKLPLGKSAIGCK